MVIMSLRGREKAILLLLLPSLAQCLKIVCRKGEVEAAPEAQPKRASSLSPCGTVSLANDGIEEKTGIPGDTHFVYQGQGCSDDGGHSILTKQGNTWLSRRVSASTSWMGPTWWTRIWSDLFGPPLLKCPCLVPVAPLSCSAPEARGD